MSILFNSCAVNREIGKKALKDEGYDTTRYNNTFSEALRQKMLGNIPNAVEGFENALKINKKSDAAAYEISIISALRGDMQNGKKFALKAHRIDLENQWYILNLANIYYQENNADSVIYYYEKLLDHSPQREDIKYNLANIYVDAGKFDQAEVIYKEFREIYGDIPELLIGMIRVYDGMGCEEEEEILIKKLIEEQDNKDPFLQLLAEFYASHGRNEEAKDIYKELLIDKPGNGMVQLSYLEFLINAKEENELTDFVNTVMISDSVKLEDKLVLFKRIIDDTLLIRKKEKEILIAGMILAAQYKNSVDIVLLRNELFEKLGRTESQIKLLEEFLLVDGNQYIVYEKLLLLLNNGRMNDKLYNYSLAAAKKFNRAPLPKMLLAVSAKEMKKYELALNELNKVKILINEQEEFMLQIISLEAEIYYDKMMYDEAFGKYEEALAINDKDPLILNNYAYFLSEQERDLDKAYEMIQECLRYDKNNTYIDSYAWICYKMKKYRKAYRIMEDLFAENEIEDPDIIEHFGYIYLAIGKKEEAVRMLEKAIAADSERKEKLKAVIIKWQSIN